MISQDKFKNRRIPFKEVLESVSELPHLLKFHCFLDDSINGL